MYRDRPSRARGRSSDEERTHRVDLKRQMRIVLHRSTCFPKSLGIERGDKMGANSRSVKVLNTRIATKMGEGRGERDLTARVEGRNRVANRREPLPSPFSHFALSGPLRIRPRDRKHLLAARALHPLQVWAEGRPFAAVGAHRVTGAPLERDVERVSR
jgi:hypothetical protein